MSSIANFFKYTSQALNYYYQIRHAYAIGRGSLETYRQWNNLTDEQKNDRLKLIFIGVADITSAGVGIATSFGWGNVQNLNRFKLILDASCCSVEFNRRITKKMRDRNSLEWQDYFDVFKEAVLPRLSGLTESLVNANIPYLQKLETAAMVSSVISELYLVNHLWDDNPDETTTAQRIAQIAEVVPQLRTAQEHVNLVEERAIEDHATGNPEEAAKIRQLIGHPEELKKYLDETIRELENYNSYLYCADLDAFINKLEVIPEVLRKDEKLLRYKCPCCNQPIRSPLVKRRSNRDIVPNTLYEGKCLLNWNKTHPGEPPLNWDENISGKYNYDEMVSDLGARFIIHNNIKEAYNEKTESLKKRLSLLQSLLKIENARRINVNDNSRVRVLVERVDRILKYSSSKNSDQVVSNSEQNTYHHRYSSSSTSSDSYHSMGSTSSNSNEFKQTTTTVSTHQPLRSDEALPSKETCFSYFMGLLKEGIKTCFCCCKRKKIHSQ